MQLFIYRLSDNSDLISLKVAGDRTFCQVPYLLLFHGEELVIESLEVDQLL